MPSDMSAPIDHIISVQKYNKISKYKELGVEVEKMWHLKSITVLIVVKTLGMIKKGTDKHINKIPGSHSLDVIQKVSLCGILLILRRVTINDWKISPKRDNESINA